MAILSKGNTFSDGDQVTSTSLNNLVDNAAFVAGSSGTTDDETLEVNGSGRLQVKAIQTGNIANGAVTTAKIADDGVTTAKIADDAVTTAKIADDAVTNDQIADNAIQQAQMADNSVGTAEIIDANITASKLSGAQSGDAPVFGVRAWGRISSTPSIINGSGLASVTGSAGAYTILLSENWTQTPVVLATCYDTTNYYNYSAKVAMSAPNIIYVRTGFEDTPNLAAIAFQIAVIY
jgi:hypothetical protein